MPTPEQRKEYRRRWRVKNPDYGRQWYERNKDTVKKRARQWELQNPEKTLEKKRQWAAKNPDKRIKARRKWKENNPEKIRLGWIRRRLNPHERLRQALSARLRQAIHKRSCGIKTVEMLGCSLADFVIYLESKFEVGMSWENYGRKAGQWSVDHILPCAIFDLTKPEHRLRCFHFSNLQPMWHIKNMRKNAKVTTNQFNLL